MNLRALALVLLLGPLTCVAQVTKGEPTNAKEAAAKKAAQDALVDARYEAWLAKLSPEELAWEKVLQSQLGGFYLPLHKRDKIAGKSNAWDFVKDDPKLPRVLLIGDSVSRGYTQPARKALAGKANLHRAPANCGPTASGLKNLDIWLGEGKWDVIHFNFGIHDRATPLADYRKRLEGIVVRLKKTGARLIWAATTPIPDNPAQKQTAASVVERDGQRQLQLINRGHAHLQLTDLQLQAQPAATPSLYSHDKTLYLLPGQQRELPLPAPFPLTEGQVLNLQAHTDSGAQQWPVPAVRD